jgi:hypothetical protein
MRKRNPALLAIFAIVVLSCDGNNPPSWRSLVQASAKRREAQQARVPTTDEAIVYLDASKSMQGYVTASGKTVYGTTLQELRNVGSLLDTPLRTWVRKVDATVGARLPDIELNRASTNAAVYGGNETNLADAIAQFAAPAAPVAPVAAKQVQPVPRIHILVTDGVQSTDGATTSSNCDSGSDQVCVRAQFMRLLGAGWSGCLIGIRSEFSGVIYSEINHNTRGRAYAIPYHAGSDDPAAMRPFYLYLFSPDRTALTQFVTTLKRRLRAGLPHLVLRELPLNGDFTQGQATARLLTSGSSAGLISLAGEGGRGAPTDRITVRFGARDATENTAGPVDLSVTLPWSPDALDMGSPSSLGRLVVWEAVPLETGEYKSAGHRVPQLRLAPATVGDDGQIRLSVTPVWPAGTGDPVWLGYALRAHLNLSADTPGWIGEWSTNLDNAPEYGNRTLFLENAALGIWRNHNRQPEMVGEIYVRVGP